MAQPTVGDVIDQALVAYAGLETRAAAIEDEWPYVDGLTRAWRARLATVRAGRSDEAAPPGVGEAIDEVATEADLIVDPHRCIDWLSTLPQVVLGALDEPS
jgi:hypothetical protein